MASKFRTVFFLLPFLLFPAATAFNITLILGQFSDFSNLNNLLTQTQLASEINSRQTITVLAVNNAALSSVSNLPTDVLKKVLALHVVLDYFDRDKISKLSNRSAILTTLFQASGLATGQNNGFLNVTNMGNGQIALGSAAPGSNLTSQFLSVLVTHPYNISVVQISSVIVPPGLGISNNTGSSSPSPAPSSSFPAPRMSPGPSIGAPRVAPMPAFAPRRSMAPAPSPSYRSPSPSDAASPQPVVVRPPAPRAAPPMTAGGSPLGSPTGSPGRVADVPSPTAPDDDSSGAQHVVGAGLVVAMGAAFLMLSKCN